MEFLLALCFLGILQYQIDLFNINLLVRVVLDDFIFVTVINEEIHLKAAHCRELDCLFKQTSLPNVVGDVSLDSVFDEL